MNLRSIPRGALTTSLTLARVPLDAAIGLLPRRRAESASLAADRADATIRSVAGTLTADRQLREDARKRRAATNERRKAAALRGRAEQVTEDAHETAEVHGERAQRRRTEADRRAARRRTEAKRDAERNRSRAATAEQRRKEASRKVEDRVETQIEAEAPEKRLDALEERAEAEEQAVEALTAADEAQRLGDAAAAVKEERKES